MLNSNRTVVDLNKVSYANFNWTTLCGSICRSKKPKEATVNGEVVSEKEFAPAIERWPRETMLARAKRRNLLDIWQPHLRLQLSNSHSLEYTGDKAVSIWKEWNRRQFSKKKQ